MLGKHGSDPLLILIVVVVNGLLGIVLAHDSWPGILGVIEGVVEIWKKDLIPEPACLQAVEEIGWSQVGSEESYYFW
ncbi:MAG: hypothetical protein J3R72DRAFT_451066 [Linnemannia gamsii]|nr:MAG: hypothetical protein J3R72DRAFT_451066 [Linnemannia gamsii]